MKKTFERRMDERGYVPIPNDIQAEFNLKAAELPTMIVKKEEEPAPHIALYPKENMTVDNSQYIAGGIANEPN